MKLQDKDLINICGGTMSATMLNAMSRAMATILELGRSVGTSIRRLYSKNYC